MDLESVSLRQLRYLVEVADGTPFSDAADRLHVSQSALSQGLARLEDLAGARLFEPDGRRRRLTSAGEELAGYARRVLGDTAGVGDRLRARAEGRAGTLRVALIDAAALYLLPGKVETFRRDNPDVELVITVATSGQCLDRLRSFSVDVAVVVGPASGFVAVPVIDEPLLLFGPAAQPEAGSPWLLYPTGSHTRSMIDSALAARRFAPSVVAESGNPAVLRQLALLMDGWTVLPKDIGGRRQGVWGPREELASRTVVVATRGGPSDELARRFVQTMLS
jgi:DNA-binding transcriptional LysR family regulator